MLASWLLATLSRKMCSLLTPVLFASRRQTYKHLAIWTLQSFIPQSKTIDLFHQNLHPITSSKITMMSSILALSVKKTDLKKKLFRMAFGWMALGQVQTR